MCSAKDSPLFKYHGRCKKNAITHISFADDLMFFCHGDSNSVGIIKDCLDNFAKFSGLSINLNKSSLFMSGVSREDQRAIVDKLGVQVQPLPVTYLGIPLITSRLSKTDCLPLLEPWGWVVERCISTNVATTRLVGLVLAAAIYHIWQERNRRIHDHHFSSWRSIL
ncbi:RNA-directed DNA polymerase, eukaryota, reverse transcriptase [Salix suchowensis]|nr:RNA-directed DNA polymerase, eukaryota, reverse transcriptase [Salix suchowensis]